MAVSGAVMPAVSQAACFASSSSQPSSSYSTPGCSSKACFRMCRRSQVSISRSGSSSFLGGVTGFQSRSDALPHTQARVAARAMATESAPAVQYEEYEVELEKPWGLKFYKGSDGGTYVDAIQIGSSADKSGVITPGDKVLATRYVRKLDSCCSQLRTLHSTI